MDGSIRIGTKIDTSEAQKDLKKLEAECAKTAKKIKESGKGISDVYTGGSEKDTAHHKRTTAKTTKTLDKSIAEYDRLGDEIAKIQAETDKDLENAATDAQAKTLLDMEAAQTAPLIEKRAELAKQISEIETKLKGVNKEQKKEESAAKKAGDAMSAGFKKGFKQMIRVAAGIIGIRSAYMALRKAAQNYISANEELNDQLQGTWNVISVAIGPAIEWLIGLLTDAISFVSALVEKLTGVNLIAKANALALKKMSGDAGFDERNKLSGGGGMFTPSETDQEAVNTIADNFKEILTSVGLIATIIAGIDIASKLGLPLADAAGAGFLLGGAFLLIQGFIDAWSDGATLEAFAEIAGGFLLIGAAISIITGGPIPLLVAAIIAAVVGIIMFGDKIRDFFFVIGDAIEGFFDNLGAKIHGFFNEENFGFIGNLFGQMLEDIFKGFGDIFDGLFMILGSVFAIISDLFQGNWEDLLNDLIDFGNGLIKVVLGIVRPLLNAIIGLINGAIKLLNKIPGVDIKEIPLIGDFEFPHVKLAKGGIVSNPGRGVPAVIGEAGREAVLPLDANTEWMDELASRIGGGNVTVPVYLDGRVIYKAMIKRGEEMKFQTNGAR